MRTIRNFAVSVLCALMASLAVGAFSVPLGVTPAGATTSQWQTTASFPPLANLRAVSCAPSASTSTTCIAVGDDQNNVPSIVTSDDGGSNWTNAKIPTGVIGLSAVACPTNSVCFAGGNPGILDSKDGGRTWSVDDSGFLTFGLSCISATECTAVGGSSTILKTTDGTTWSPQVPPSGLNSLASVSCTSSTVCVAVGVDAGSPAAVATQNGANWTVLSAISAHALKSVSCTGPTNCVAVGTTNSGVAGSFSTVNLTSWTTPTSIPLGVSLNAVSCTNTVTCIAVGTDHSGTPYGIVTNNNGQTWTAQSAPANAVDLQGLSCANLFDCVAVGDTGNVGSGSTIMTTATAGETWTPQSPPLGTERSEFGGLSLGRSLHSRWSRFHSEFFKQRTRLDVGTSSRPG